MPTTTREELLPFSRLLQRFITAECDIPGGSSREQQRTADSGKYGAHCTLVILHCNGSHPGKKHIKLSKSKLNYRPAPFPLLKGTFFSLDISVYPTPDLPKAWVLSLKTDRRIPPSLLTPAVHTVLLPSFRGGGTYSSIFLNIRNKFGPQVF